MRSIIPVVVLLMSGLSQAEAPEAFTLESLDGQSYTLPQEQEGVGIYLFWASWCPYCQALMPHIQSIRDQYGDAVSVYALNFRDEEDPAELLERHGFDFVVFPDADPVAEQWGVHGTPGLFIVDADGEVRFNLYEIEVDDPPGYDEMSHGQKASRRAPLWAARIREVLAEVMAGSE